MVQADQKGFPTEYVYVQENRVAAVGKDSLVIMGGGGGFAFNLPIINNQCDLQNNLQKMIGFIIAINYSV